MKLLLDQNLSPRLVTALENIYPGMSHVRQFGMEASPDNDILAFAKENGFILVSKDTDFLEPQVMHDQSVKIVWIKRGN